MRDLFRQRDMSIEKYRVNIPREGDRTGSLPRGSADSETLRQQANRQLEKSPYAELMSPQQVTSMKFK